MLTAMTRPFASQEIHCQEQWSEATIQPERKSAGSDTDALSSNRATLSLPAVRVVSEVEAAAEAEAMEMVRKKI